MKEIGLIYGSDTGMTEEITSAIVDKWDLCNINVIEVSEVKKEDFDKYNILILGLSTWYDGDLQSEWESYYNEFKTIDFTGKTIALYGLGDQYGYGEYFIDGVGILAEIILKNNGNITGYWPTKEYAFEKSKALFNNDFFYGLAIDEDNQPELTEQRIKDWLSILKDEFSFILN